MKNTLYGKELKETKKGVLNKTPLKNI